MVIKIKGKEYPLRRTMWALLTFQRDKEKLLSQVKTDEQEDILYYTWLCVRGACLQDGMTFDMSFEDYVIFVEDDPTMVLFETSKKDVKKKEEKS